MEGFALLFREMTWVFDERGSTHTPRVRTRGTKIAKMLLLRCVIEIQGTRYSQTAQFPYTFLTGYAGDLWGLPCSCQQTEAFRRQVESTAAIRILLFDNKATTGASRRGGHSNSGGK